MRGLCKRLASPPICGIAAGLTVALTPPLRALCVGSGEGGAPLGWALQGARVLGDRLRGEEQLEDQLNNKKRSWLGDRFFIEKRCIVVQSACSAIGQTDRTHNLCLSLSVDRLLVEQLEDQLNSSRAVSSLRRNICCV